jgi:DNA-binding CsgD family transcriptional regulator/tetratricopeptide (TPR) repeat protein
VDDRCHARHCETVAAPLLERDDQLAALRDALAVSMRGPGGMLVLLGGEAGGGKTALLRRFCAEAGTTVLWGSCDPLFTPRPLGPFVDMAAEAGGELRALVDSGARSHQVAAALAAAAQARSGLIVVLEDLHWADEATLDVLSLVGRRIASIPALVVASYRDDELDRTHPLRRLLGELRDGRTTRRLTAPPLSAGAVASLAEPHGVDAGDLYRATAGNPFFVTEVLAARGDIPATVRDAVLARAARLNDAAIAVAEAIAIALPHAELWLLDALAPDGADGLTQCLSAGVLESVPGGIGFRHELARLAIEESLSPHRRRALHRAALGALTTPPHGAADPARLAYHAEAAEDPEAVLRYAAAAARHAAATGAHREAAAQYARALRFGDSLTPSARARLLEGLSYACYLTDQTEASIEALDRAIDCHRLAGDERGEGAALSTLSRRLWCGGRSADATKAGQAGILLLEQLPPGPELALAYSNLSQIYLNDEQLTEAVEWGNRALELAEVLGETAVIVHSLNNIGTVQLLAGLPEGTEKMERSLAMAEAAGLEEHVGRAYIHVGWAVMRTRSHELAPWLDRGITACEELGLETWALYLVAYRAQVHLNRGNWTEAADDATHVLDSARSLPLLRILALTVLGLVRARRGDPDPWSALDEAHALLDGQDELQYLAPVATARAEAAWLDGRADAVDVETRDVLELARDRAAGWVVGELTWLRRLAGIAEPVRGVAPPYARQLTGDASDALAAARQWTDLGCPYDAALAVLDSGDETALRAAHADLQRLGARSAAAIVARRLRERGVRGLPRGPRPPTRDNPASLTRREAEVLALVTEGASNADIAARLYLSEKTVHHHVSAILRKLGVDSRGQAAAEAARRGLTAGSL